MLLRSAVVARPNNARGRGVEKPINYVARGVHTVVIAPEKKARLLAVCHLELARKAFVAIRHPRDPPPLALHSQLNKLKGIFLNLYLSGCHFVLTVYLRV